MHTGRILDPVVTVEGIVRLVAPNALGMGGLTKIDGRIEIKVVVKAGEDSLAATLADQIARRFPRGDDIHFDDGTGTITTPRKSAPVCDGKRTEAVVNVGLYAFQA